MCVNWTEQLNWGWDPYFVRGVKTEMSYIAVNEVKSTTIKTGKGGASPCNPSIRATLFNRGLWSKLESKGSLACGRFCRLGSLRSGRYVLRALVGFFFSCREIRESFVQHQAMITSILIPFSPYLPRQKIDHGTIAFHCRLCLTMVGDGVTVVYDSLWPWYAISSWPWYIANHGYKINQCFLLNQLQQITK